jgi:hypothetical protein
MNGLIPNENTGVNPAMGDMIKRLALMLNGTGYTGSLSDLLRRLMGTAGKNKRGGSDDEAGGGYSFGGPGGLYTATPEEPVTS